jgi:hypothetical protein
MPSHGTGFNTRTRSTSIFPSIMVWKNSDLYRRLEMLSRLQQSTGHLPGLSAPNSFRLSTHFSIPSPTTASSHFTPGEERLFAHCTSRRTSDCLRSLLSITPSSVTSGRTESEPSSPMQELDECRLMFAMSPTAT